jgi:parvulin-like peptidyl-prolyl isomerase
MRLAAASAAILLLAQIPATRAEVVEEVVAWVNGDIITKSEYEKEEEAALADVYRDYSGAELDEQVQAVRKRLLLWLIDTKILVDQAERLYPVEKMRESFYQDFKKQNGITDDAELERLLAREGLTVEDWKDRLVERHAPEYVVRFEVGSRLSVSDAEIEAAYQEGLEQFRVPAQVTLREIVLKAEGQEEKERRRPDAEAALRRLESGEEFWAVAAEVSESSSSEEGGLLGAMKRDDLSEVLREPASTLEPGKVSGIIDAPYGFHIIKMESRSEEHVRPLDEVRGEVRRTIEDRKYTTERNAYMERTRSESEWCVKPKYQALLSVPAPAACAGL